MPRHTKGCGLCSGVCYSGCWASRWCQVVQCVDLARRMYRRCRTCHLMPWECQGACMPILIHASVNGNDGLLGQTTSSYRSGGCPGQKRSSWVPLSRETSMCWLTCALGHMACSRTSHVGCTNLVLGRMAIPRPCEQKVPGRWTLTPWASVDGAPLCTDQSPTGPRDLTESQRTHVRLRD